MCVSHYPAVIHSLTILAARDLVRRGLDVAHDFEFASASGAVRELLLVGDYRNCQLRIEDGIRHYPRDLGLCRVVNSVSGETVLGETPRH